MIQLSNITLAYGSRILLKDVTARLEAGTLISLIGRNGTGKSTLLRAIAGVDTRSVVAGSIMLCGVPSQSLTASQRARMVSVVTTDKCRIANLPVEDAVALGRAPYTNWIGHMQPDDRAVVAQSLEMVGMQHFARKSMDSLSDGEAQRVMIARALAQQTPIILLDEPTAFLDMAARYELVALLRRLASESGKCILFSTHELDIALAHSDMTALIDTPQLHLSSAAEMSRCGLIERLFAGVDLGLDIEKSLFAVKKG